MKGHGEFDAIFVSGRLCGWFRDLIFSMKTEFSGVEFGIEVCDESLEFWDDVDLGEKVTL